MESVAEPTCAAEIAALRRENAMLRETLDAIDGTVAVYDADMRYCFGNRGYHELFPHAPPDEDLVGRSFEELLRASIAAGAVNDPNAYRDTEAFIARRVAEINDRNQTTRELYNPHSDRWSQIRVKWTPGGNRVALRIDITSLKRLQQELLRAHRMETIGRISGGVAQDFNNLLTIITGNLEMIRLRAADPARVAALARSAMTAAENGARLIRQLLTFAHRDLTQPRLLDPNALLTAMADLLRRTGGPDVDFRMDLAKNLGEAHFDSTQFESAVANLVLNAREALVGRGSPRRIAVITGHERIDDVEFLTISVTDTGPGMTEEAVAQAFEPFFTTKPVGCGPGLGLSQVHGFATGANGQARISSGPDRGTTVTILLPRAS
jgi:signal transduction histidine kinase